MKVGFSPKRKSLFKVFYLQNSIITGGFYESVLFCSVLLASVPCNHGSECRILPDKHPKVV